MRQYWRSVRPEQTLRVSWGDAHIVYHKPSGKTHLLNASTVDLLDNVLAEPKTSEAALLELADHLAIEPDESFAIHFAGLMAHLEDLGLVVRA